MFTPHALRLVLRYKLGVDTGLEAWAEWAIWLVPLSFFFGYRLKQPHLKYTLVWLGGIVLATVILGSTVHLFDSFGSEAATREFFVILALTTAVFVFLWEVIYRILLGSRWT